MKKSRAPDQRVEAELHQAVADKEHRLEDLSDEMRRAQTRLEALRSELMSAKKAGAGVVADSIHGCPASTPTSASEKVALFRSLFLGREDVFPVRFESKRWA